MSWTRPGLRTLSRSLQTLLVGLAGFAALGSLQARPSYVDGSEQLRVEDKPASDTVQWLAEHYVKYEHRIPMRDGVRLFTRVYVPKDDSTNYPIVLTRTPYAIKPYGSDNFQKPGGSFEALAKDRFILVSQDVRGRFGSEGEYVHVRPHRPNKRGPQEIDESSDTWDTIDWLVKNVPGNNGKVGMFGISYPGFYTAMGMIDSHPALKAASPQAPISDWFMGDDIHHNGAFFLTQNFGFFYWMDQKVRDPKREELKNFYYGTEDSYDFFMRLGSLSNGDKRYFKGAAPIWNEFLQHTTYDAWWQARNIRPHLKNVNCAVMTVGGWFDAEDLFGPLQVHQWVGKLNPGTTNLLVMGPWSHGAWGGSSGDRLGAVSFSEKTGEYYREKLELPFFRRYLKGDTNPVLAKATMFETGMNRWRKFDAWPPRESVAKTLYLQPAGGLSFQPANGGDAVDEFISDPAKPVPYTLEMQTGYPRSYPLHDQRFVSSRTDVLVYQTPPLEEDLTLSGPLRAALEVSTSGTDADWVVKVVDVYPDDFPNPSPNPASIQMGGYQQLVRGDVIRGRFRNSFEKPEPFQPGKRSSVAFDVPDVFHTFRRGHRLMVHVQSSWFPLVDRNPQTYVNIPTATESDFKKATHRVFLGGPQGSRIDVRVLGASK